MSQLVYQSEVRPEIDWENPLTDGLVALFMVDGDSVVEIISKTIGTGTPTILNSYWYGGVDFPLSEIPPLFQQNQEMCSLVLGEFRWRSNTSATTPLWVVNNASNQYLEYEADYSYGEVNKSRIRGGYASVTSAIQSAESWKTEVLAFNGTVNSATNKILNISMYQDGQLSTASGEPFRSGTDALETFSAGSNADNPIYYIALFNQRKTEQELQEVEINPYQLFKTEEKVLEEYGLSFTIAGHQVKFPFVGAFTGEVTYTDATTAAISGTDTYTLDGTIPVSVARVTGTDTVKSYLWEFNQSHGDYVTDHINAAIATLVGFPIDSGYIKNEATGEIAGYQFGGATTATLPLTGAYTGTITYSDDTTLAISGSGNYVVDSSHASAIKSIEVTDTDGTLFFDATTGDQVKIFETVSANHATITADSVVKWQPIVKEAHFILGAAYDYADTAAWYAANNNANYHYVLHMTEMESGGFTTTGSALNLGATFKAKSGLDPVNNVAQVGFTGVLRNSSAGNNFYYSIGSQNFNIEGNTTLIDGCVVDGLNSATIIGITPNSGKVVVKSTIIKNCNDGVYNNKIPVKDMVVIDSIIENSNRYATVTATLVNTILKDNTNDPTASNAQYCVTTKGTLAGTGNIVNAQASWFDANTQITPAGQTALVGKGWNNSDIGSWAYFIEQAGGLTPLTKLFSAQLDIIERKSKSFTGSVALLAQVNKSYQALIDFLSTNSVNKVFSFELDVLQQQQAQVQLVTDLLGRESHAFNGQLDLLQAFTKSHTSQCDLLARNALTHSGLVNFLGHENVNFGAVFDLLNQQSKNFTGEINLNQAVSKAFTSQVDFYHRVNKSFTYQFDTLATGTASKAFSFQLDFIGRLQKQYTSELDLLQRQGLSHQLSLDLLDRVAKDFSAKFDLHNTQSKSFTVTLDTIGRVGKTFDVVFNIQSDDTPKTPAHYVISIEHIIEFIDPPIQTIEFIDNPIQTLIV
jgi:hypothetical protein